MIPISPKEPSSVWLEFTLQAMACQFEILLHPNRPTSGPEAALEALELIRFLEQTLSIYIPTSDLSRLNQRALETEVQVSLPTMEMLRLALDIHRETEGAFDITAARLSEVWGFASRQGRMPDEQAIHAALQQVGSQAIALHDATQEVRFSQPISVNPGGIGKGFAIDQAAEHLRNQGVEEFAIHGGKSSVRAHGRQLTSTTEPGWKIAVRHPEQSQRILGTLILRDAALGTSGPANQFFYFRGVRYGHIIDPRSGWPVSGPLSVSVIHPSAAWADALATGLYVMGLDAAIRYCESRPHVGMLALLPGQRQGAVEVVTCNLSSEMWMPADPSEGVGGTPASGAMAEP
jgi:FAD:protein FMN transferase